MTPGDRQSYYKDCHILQDRFHGTPSSTTRRNLSKSYGLPARTLRVVGTAHNGILDSAGIFLTAEDCCCSIFLLVCQIRGFKDLEANPKDSGDKYRRLLDKPLAFLPGPWMAGLCLLESGIQVD
jgi:hypothetical protein